MIILHHSLKHLRGFNVHPNNTMPFSVSIIRILLLRADPKTTYEWEFISARTIHVAGVTVDFLLRIWKQPRCIVLSMRETENLDTCQHDGQSMQHLLDILTISLTAVADGSLMLVFKWNEKPSHPWRITVAISAIDPLVVSNFHPNRCEFPPTLLQYGVSLLAILFWYCAFGEFLSRFREWILFRDSVGESATYIPVGTLLYLCMTVIVIATCTSIIFNLSSWSCSWLQMVQH
jgi:hypothetical protein